MTTITSASSEWRNKGWENEESTSSIVKRDTGVEIHGSDRTRAQVRHDDAFFAAGGGTVDVVDFARKAQQMETDQTHVALAQALDLPAASRQRSLDARCDVQRGEGTGAGDKTKKLQADHAGLAVLQAHCDRGVLSAYVNVPNPMPEGMTFEAFLASNSQLKEIAKDDPAFRLGLEAFFNGSPAERKELLANVEKHDVRVGNGVRIGG